MNAPPHFHEAKSIFGADKKLLFVFLCMLTFLLLFVKKSFIENETAAFEFLLDKPEGAILRTISTLQFISIPLVYLWKFTIVALVIWIGCFLFGYRVTYKQCWGIAVVAEFIFIIPELIKITWFLTAQTDPTIHDIRAFYPLSFIHLFDYEGIDKRWAYPLRALNVFEVVYWFILVSGIHYYSGKEKKTAWIIAAFSYILLFFFWLGFYAIVYK